MKKSYLVDTLVFMIFLKLIELAFGITETSDDVSPTMTYVCFYNKYVVDRYLPFARTEILNGLWHRSWFSFRRARSRWFFWIFCALIDIANVRFRGSNFYTVRIDYVVIYNVCCLTCKEWENWTWIMSDKMIQNLFRWGQKWKQKITSSVGNFSFESRILRLSRFFFAPARRILIP